MSARIDVSLYLVTDRTLAQGRSLVDVVRQAMAGGVTMVQIREKSATTKTLVALATTLLDALRPQGVPLIVNDRIDVALAIDAAGAHVGQDDMPVHLARRILGPDRILGVSVSTVDEARRARSEGADYLGVSPVFDTPTKTDTPAATGLAGLRAIRAATDLPLVGIGGLHVGNAQDVVAAGADGIAVVSAIMAAQDPTEAAHGLRAVIERGRMRP